MRSTSCSCQAAWTTASLTTVLSHDVTAAVRERPDTQNHSFLVNLMSKCCEPLDLAVSCNLPTEHRLVKSETFPHLLFIPRVFPRCLQGRGVETLFVEMLTS